MCKDRNTAKFVFSALIKLVVCSLLLFTLVACEEETPSFTDDLFVPTEHSYKTVNVELGEFVNEEDSAAGLSYAYDRILTHDRNSFFEAMLVEAGDIVKKGDNLAAFYTNASKVPLEETKLNIERAENDLQNLKNNYSSQRKMQEQLLRELEEGSYEYKAQELNMEKEKVSYEQNLFNTENRISALYESLDEINEDLSLSYITAPFDGLIADVEILEKGDSIGTNTQILRIVSHDKFLIKVNSPDGFRFNDTVDIFLSHGQNEFQSTAKVISSPDVLSHQLSESNTYVFVDLNDPSSKEMEEFIMSYGGLRYSLSVETNGVSISDILYIDRKAVFKEDGRNYVNIMEDGTVKKRSFTSSFDNTEYYVIVDGLEEGQIVLVE